MADVVDTVNKELNVTGEKVDTGTGLEAASELAIEYEDVLKQVAHILKDVNTANLGANEDFKQLAVLIKKIANMLPNRPPFSSMAWWKKFQFLYNAYVVESNIKMAVANNSKIGLEYGDGEDSHEKFSSSHARSNEPDFRLVDKATSELIGYLEVKLCQNKTSFKNERARYHYKNKRDADLKFFVICFIIDPEPGFVYKVATGNGRFGNCTKQDLEAIGIVFHDDEAIAKIMSNLVKFNLDIANVADTELLSCTRFTFGSKSDSIKEAFGSPYGNVLDISKALANKDECIQLIRDQYGYDGPIETGGYYIMPDGSAVKSVNHADIDKFLARKGYIEGEVKDYGDGSQFMDAINCVRLRRRGGRDAWILPYMILPENQLTAAQYAVVENWVNFVMAHSGELSMQTITGKYKNYHSDSDTAEVIQDIHMFYRTATLEDFEYELLDEPEIDNTDYELKNNLKKGFYDQF